VWSRCYATIVEMGGYTRPISGQQLGKHVPAATKETECFFVVCAMYVLRCYKQGTRAAESQSNVEAGSNTSTVALRVAGGDEK
jgi:hypothetical protein